MKYSKTIKFIASSIIASALLVACSSSSDVTSYVTNSGIAIDPELQDASVFLDINENGVLDADEPSTTTDALGKYFLRIETQYVGAPILVQGGIDRVTKEQFMGQLSVISEEENINLHITPLTSLIQEYKKANPDEEVEAIKASLAANLGIEIDDLDANTVEEGNEALLQISLRIQKIAQGITDNSDTDIETVYADIANELQYTDLDTALINSCNNHINDTVFAYEKLLDLQHELSLVDSNLTAEELALTMDNIEQNVTSATTQEELDVDVYDDETLQVSNALQVQEQLKIRTYSALGLSDLDEETKTLIEAHDDIDFENDSLEDLINKIMDEEMDFDIPQNYTLTLQEMLVNYAGE